MPVMEGKCALFKRFGNVDAIPLCVRSKNVDERGAEMSSRFTPPEGMLRHSDFPR